MGRDIRVALDLVATTSGVGSIQSLIYALSSIGSSAGNLVPGLGALGVTFGDVIGVAAAAAAESLAFDSALRLIIGDATAIQYTSAQMNLALHGTTEQTKQLDQATIQWAEDSLYSTAQVHQLTTALAEHGLSTEQILNGVGQAAIQLGEAINTDPVEAANLLASTLQMFSAQGLTATDAANMLTAAFYNGVGSASELQQAFDMAGGQMVAAGGSAQDLAANIDLLAQAGLSGSSAGASLRYVLQSMTAPTKAQAAAMNFLGLSVVNTTSPAFHKLTQELDASGKAGQKAVTGFDGTSVGLNNMFTEAQKLGLIPLNETFNTWAAASGAMSTKFYDAKGNFVGLGNSIGDIIDSIKKKAHGNKELELNLIESMFNVRSGRAIGILASMTDYKDKYNGIIKEIGKTSASKDASDLLKTLQGAWQQLQTTFSSTAGQAGTTILPMLTGLAQAVNGLLGNLQKNNPQLLQFLAIFITVGAVLAPLVTIVGAIIILFSLFSEVLIPLGIALALIPLIAGLVAGAIQQVHTKGTFLYNLFQTLGPAIQGVGTFLQQLGTIWTDQIGPAFAQALPVLKIVGIVIGVVIVAALALAVAMFLIVIAVITGVFLVIGLLIQGIGWLLGAMGNAWDWMWTTTPKVWNAIANAIGSAWNLVTTNIGNALGWIGSHVAAAWNLVTTNIGNVMHWIVTSIQNAWTLVTTNIHNVWTGIGQFFGGLVSTAESWGKNIIQGLINGLKNMAGAAVSTISGIAGNMVGAVKGIFHINSPSQVFHDFGTNISQGLINGIQSVDVVGQAAHYYSGLNHMGLSGGGNGTGGGTQVYNVNVGNQPLFQMVMDQLTGQLKINGFGRQWK